jgi:hypothetical protein
MAEYPMIRGDWGSTNATVEGITIVASPFFNFFAGTHEVNGVKVISPWYYSTDGFQGVNKVDSSFAFVGDNVFFPIWAGIANDGITVTNSFAGTTGNAVFCGGYWGVDTTNVFSSFVDNIDIKTYNNDSWVRWGAPLEPSIVQVWVDNHESSLGYANQTYQNIRVDGDLYAPMASLKNMMYPWYDPSASPVPMGNSYNIVLKNITVQGTQAYKSEIKGLDAASGFHNVVLENVQFSGTLVTPDNLQEYFDINPFVWDLTFTAPRVVTCSPGKSNKGCK